MPKKINDRWIEIASPLPYNRAFRWGYVTVFVGVAGDWLASLDLDAAPLSNMGRDQGRTLRSHPE
jgi:hypothetical protein